MLLSHEMTLNNIDTYDGYIYIWGRSFTTKSFFDNNTSQWDRIDGIVDNNSSLYNQTFHNKVIYSLDNCLKNKNLLIVILGNHIKDIVKQLKNRNFTNYIIDYEYSKNYFPKKFTIELDYLKKNNNLNDFNYKFCDCIIEYCIENSIECHIVPYKWRPSNETKENIIKNYLVYNKELERDTFVFTYHSIGNVNPQICRWKEGYLYNTITFDPKGYSGWSCLAETYISSSSEATSVYEEYFLKLQDKHISKNLSKYSQLDDEFEFPEKYIFFPLQIFNDTVMVHSYFDPLFLLQNIVEILNSKNINLVVKQHPKCKNKELKEVLLDYEKQKKVILFSGSIHNAIKKASTIYVINSGVGFESLLHLKPVVSFGKSDYSHVTRNVDNLDQIYKKPWHSLTKMEKEKIKLFLYYFNTEKSFELSNKKEIKKKIHTFVIDYLNKEYYENS